MEKSAGGKQKEIGRVTAVCLSRKKGERKHPAGSITLREGYGVVGDAHGGSERQVSLLCEESMEKILCLNPGIRAAGAGAFAENIRMTGIAFACLSIGTLLRIGDNALLRVSQIGKKCHSACTIRSMIGACIMPEEGIFAEVLRGGEVRAGDEVKTEKVL